MKTKFKIVAASCILAMTAPSFAEVVVIVNPKNTASSMSNDQVAQVFLGKSNALSPIDQGDTSGVRTEFYKKVTGKDASQVKAVWSKLVFTGKATLPKELGNSADVKKAVAGNSNAIGYIEKSSLDSTVKAVLTVQ